MNILNSNKARTLNRKRLIKRKIVYYEKATAMYIKIFAKRFKNFPSLISPKYPKNGDVDNVIYIQSPLDKSANMTCMMQLEGKE